MFRSILLIDIGRWRVKRKLYIIDRSKEGCTNKENRRFVKLIDECQYRIKFISRKTSRRDDGGSDTCNSLIFFKNKYFLKSI